MPMTQPELAYRSALDQLIMKIQPDSVWATVSPAMPILNPNIVLLSALPTPMGRTPPKPALLIVLLSPLCNSMPRMATLFACQTVWLSLGLMLTLTPIDAC